MGITDTIQFTCTACGHGAEFPRAQEGKAIYCPKCQAAQVVRGTGRFEAERIPTGRIAKAETAPSTDRIPRQPFGSPSRIDFTCSACNHTSRISATLAGQPVRCPTCGTVQLAGVGGLRVVRLDASNKLPFTCTACAYQARLSPDYAGKAIRCPKCQGAQVVPRVLRDPSGAQQALPPGTGVVRRDAGAGKPGGSGTGSIRKEPSPALRTPAGGIQVPAPMAQPTPLPGTLDTAPKPRPQLADALRTPLPMAMPAASSSGPLVAQPRPAAPAPAAEAAPVETPPAPPAAPTSPAVLAAGDDLFAPAADEAPPRQRGGVVRRSGRMNTPPPPAEPPPVPPNLGAEPTLEAARAVEVEADGHAPAEPPSRQVSRPWLVPALAVAAIVAIGAAVVVGLLLASANGRNDELVRQLNAEKSSAAALRNEVETSKRSTEEAAAARRLVEVDRDQLKLDLSAQRKELDAAKAEVERLKAASAGPQPAGK